MNPKHIAARTPPPIAKLALTFALATLVGGCTPSYELTSTLPSQEIKIDGRDSEWQQSLKSFDDGRVLFATHNDDRALYLCLVTSDRFVQHQIIAGRMVVWLDSTGGNDEYLGFRFPLEVVRGEETPFRREGNYNPEFDLSRLMLTRGHRAEILGTDGKSLGEIVLPDPDGLDARLGFDGRSLVWEAKIPLGAALRNSEAVNFSPKHLLGIGLQTPKFQFEREARGDESPAGRPEGGRGARGSAGGRPGTRPPGEGFTPPERLNLWFKVREATPASGATPSD